jgi:AraC-like DNA-binding protein
MLKTPDLLSNRPNRADDGIDVVGEILDAVHLTTVVFGKLELSAPWRLRIPKRAYLSFYVLSRGSGWIEVGERGSALSAGDAVLMPHGTPHDLWDAERSSAPAQDIDYAACKRPWIGESVRMGGSGAVTSMVTGHFTFGGSAARNPLLDTLPEVIHLPANAAATNPQLAGVVPLIQSESARPGPGATIVLARLADLLLIHALRYWIATTGAESCGLHAVADPTIGAALRLMHARPAEAWTVESLASAVAMSRSAFAARFSKLVGEPPLQYLARWRMTRAALLLSTSEKSVAAVADEVGYANPVAFTKAFSRFQGVGPGAYRRAHRPA